MTWVDTNVMKTLVLVVALLLLAPLRCASGHTSSPLATCERRVTAEQRALDATTVKHGTHYRAAVARFKADYAACVRQLP